MGCGESKHESVATGNTISQSKRSKSDDVSNSVATDVKATNDQVLIPKKDTNLDTNTNTLLQQKEENENVKENSNAPREVQQEESEKTKKDSDQGDNYVEDIKLNANANENEIDHEELKAEKEGNEEEIREEEEEDEMTIEGIISEGLSGISEYHSPRAKDGVDDEDEEVLAHEETKVETENGEPKKMNEENLVEKTEVLPDAEPKDSATSTEQQKSSLNATQENVIDSSTTDIPKTN